MQNIIKILFTHLGQQNGLITYLIRGHRIIVYLLGKYSQEMLKYKNDNINKSEAQEIR